MSVNRGSEDEYARRHNPIWPELERTLIEHGVQELLDLPRSRDRRPVRVRRDRGRSAMGRHRLDRRLPPLVALHARGHARQPRRQPGGARPARGLSYRGESLMHAAVDLGAGSGRVFLGDVRPDAARLEEVHRFRYAPRLSDGHLRWDIAALFDGIRAGLRDAAKIARASGAATGVGRRRFLGRGLRPPRQRRQSRRGARSATATIAPSA